MCLWSVTDGVLCIGGSVHLGFCALPPRALQKVTKKTHIISLLGKNGGGQAAGWKGFVVIFNFGQELLQNSM